MGPIIFETNAVWTSLITCSLIIIHNGVTAKKQVCVIGAGRAGLAAIKIVTDRSNDFEPIPFEQNADVGGLWIYTDSPDFDKHGLSVHSSIYKNLRTNLPKELMTYPDYRKFEGWNDDLYVSHEAVLEYLRNYTDRFHLRQYIQFRTLVTKVIPLKGGDDWRTTTWQLEMQNLHTSKEETIIYNGVMPKIPKIPGIKTFPGRVLHSRSYRRPEDFANQTIVLLGAGASGIDIARDLNEYAKLVYLSQKHDISHDINPFGRQKPLNKVQVVRKVVAVNGTKLILQDNSTITADVFIFCTGYLVDFPFLDRSSGIVVHRNHVRTLYDDSINVKNPSMAIIGLPENIDFGGQCYLQMIIYGETFPKQVCVIGASRAGLAAIKEPNRQVRANCLRTKCMRWRLVDLHRQNESG